VSSDPIIPDLMPPSACALYAPGHRVHVIQVKLTWDSEQSWRAGSLIDVDDGGWITIDVGQRRIRLWNHEPARARACIEAAGGAVVVRGHGVLTTPSERESHYCSCVAEGRTECVPPPAALDNSPSGLRERILAYGGFMAPGTDVIRALRERAEE
jgi:hypothetical protein